MKIVFMGTPDFAVPSLKILFEAGYDIVGVITATDKYGGRGKKTLLESAVKKYAVDKNLKVLQPKNLKNEAFQADLRALNADLQVVVAFRMLPEAVWNMPKIGTINLHGSLLPAFRGAAPIHWAVMTGAKQTGVTTFFLKHEIDTGDILLQDTLEIGDDDTTGEVHDQMMVMGAEVVLRSVKTIESGNYKLRPQDASKVSKAPKLYHETCEIDFNKTALEVHNHIRGLNPFPVAWTALDGKKLKIYKSQRTNEEIFLEPGEMVKIGKNRIFVGCKDKSLEILSLQPAGKKRLSAIDFINGYDLNKKLILGVNISDEKISN